MGLSIYFCDVCGTRITDADLRSGHGMLQRYDAICAGCIDLGHGKAWLEARQSASKAPSDPDIRGPEHLDKKDTVRLRTETTEDFGQAAVAMSAMGVQSSSAHAAPAVTIEEPPEGDDHPEHDVTSQLTNSPENAPVEPAVPGKEVSTASLAKKASAPAANSKKTAAAKTPNTRVSGTKSPSSAGIKPKTERTNGRDPAPGNARRTQLITTIAGVSVIVACGLYMMDNKGVINLRGRSTSAKVTSMADEQSAIQDLIHTTRAQADKAYESDDLTKLKAAHTAIEELRRRFKQFSDLAMKGGWTEKDVENWADQCNIAEAFNKDRILRDKIVSKQ